MNKNESENESRLVIQNQSFLTEKNLRQYSVGNALPRICFINCNFENISLRGGVLGSYSFQSCKFNRFNARKGEFSNCYFEDCKITNSDMTRAEFYDTYFKNCQFSGVDLAAGYFDYCKLEITTFFKSNLDLISINNVKVLKSNEWVEIEDFSSFQKHLDE